MNIMYITIGNIIITCFIILFILLFLYLLTSKWEYITTNENTSKEVLWDDTLRLIKRSTEDGNVFIIQKQIKNWKNKLSWIDINVMSYPRTRIWLKESEQDIEDIYKKFINEHDYTKQKLIKSKILIQEEIINI